jgi:isopenicillin-N epimerase
MSDLRGHWPLDPTVTFLNHGSFGACPTAVLERQQELRARMEANPVHFMVRELEPMLDQARVELAPFFGADPDDLAFVSNATSGVNAVLRSLRFAPGDELLTTTHVYNACKEHPALRRRWHRRTRRRRRRPLPRRVGRRDRRRHRVEGRTADPARVDRPRHEPDRSRLSDCAHRRGARHTRHRHADRRRPRARHGADRPRCARCGLLCRPWTQVALRAQGRRVPARPSRSPGGHPADRHQSRRHRRAEGPLALSARVRLAGSVDATPHLCLPEAIRFVGGLVPGGWDGVRARNHTLALHARDRICDVLGVPAPCPDDLVGALVAVPLPESGGPPPIITNGLDPLQSALFDRHRIEVLVSALPVPPHRMLRVTAHLYNDEQDYERLVRALRALL